MPQSSTGRPRQTVAPAKCVSIPVHTVRARPARVTTRVRMRMTPHPFRTFGPAAPGQTAARPGDTRPATASHGQKQYGSRHLAMDLLPGTDYIFCSAIARNSAGAGAPTGPGRIPARSSAHPASTAAGRHLGATFRVTIAGRRRMRFCPGKHPHAGRHGPDVVSFNGDSRGRRAPLGWRHVHSDQARTAYSPAPGTRPQARRPRLRPRLRLSSAPPWPRRRRSAWRRRRRTPCPAHRRSRLPAVTVGLVRRRRDRPLPGWEPGLHPRDN